MSKNKNYNLGTLPPVPYGYGSIGYTERNKKNPWLAQYTDEQTKKRKTLGYFSEYMQAYNALMYRKDGRAAKNAAPTFSQLYEEVSKQLLQKHPASEAGYRQGYTLLKPIHNKQIKDIVYSDITGILYDVSEKGYSRGTGENIIRVCKKVFRYAYNNRLIDRDFTNELEFTSHQQPKVKSIFTSEQIKMLWVMDNTLERNISLILLYTGLRITECMNIDENHIKDGYIVNVGIKTKAGKSRSIPICDIIKPVLDDYLQQLTNNEKPTNEAIYNYLKKHFDRSPHEARHTFITQWQVLNLNLSAMNFIVGHSQGNTNDTYTHFLNTGLLQQEMQKFSYNISVQINA